MGVKELGQEIIHQRKRLNMTQKDLGQNVCTQSALSLIERGITKPSLEIIFYISLKLRKPISHFLQYLLDDNAEYINKTVFFVEELALTQRFEDIYHLTKKELSSINSSPRSWYEQFLRWMLTCSKYRLNKISQREAVGVLKELLEDDYDLITQKDFLYYKILNSIALIHGENQDLSSALMYYNKALNSNFYQEYSSAVHQPQIYRLKILYNKAKTLYDLEKYDEAVCTLKEGIEQSKIHENISMLGQFYYYLGQTYEKQNKEKTLIKEAYESAEFIFRFLDKDLYLDILYELKDQYIEN